MNPQDIRTAIRKIDAGDVRGAREMLVSALSAAPSPEDATNPDNPIPSMPEMQAEGIAPQAAREIKEQEKMNPAAARQTLRSARARLAGGVSGGSPFMPFGGRGHR